MRKNCLSLLILLSLIFVQCTAVKEKGNLKQPKVKNVVLMIGDGMGVSQVYAGLTANRGLHLEKSQYVGFSKTYSADQYITDSAAGGTALAAGVKTKNGAIGVDPDGDRVKSILEHAADNGLSTGMVVSCAITHATPASFVGHQPKRSMQEEIALDLIDSGITLFIGGGQKYFDRRKDEQNLLEKLEEKDYRVALDWESINSTTSGKLAGFVADEHPAAYPERGELLPEGTAKALEILSQNKKGLFLMVEGSQIDFACHSNDGERAVNEMIDFDRAIKAAFDFADNNPGTLVVITADHETGGMALTGGNIETGEVNVGFNTGGHTAVMVPVFAYGEGAERFAGIYENIDVFSKILSLYNFEDQK